MRRHFERTFADAYRDRPRTAARGETDSPKMKPMKANPIIVALDVDSAEEARALVAQLGGHVNFYKVGMELYTAAGMEFVRELVGQGKDVFLDLKLYDIPETVKRAVAAVARTGVRFLTVHAVASVMRAAAEGRGDSRLKLLAVTVLTSFGPEDMEDLGYECSIADLVEERAFESRCGRRWTAWCARRSRPRWSAAWWVTRPSS